MSPKHEYGTIESVEEDEGELELEEEGKVTTIELFSDLVMVVSVHTVAEPLEEEGFTNYGTYLARVFYLWLAWHMITVFMNVSVKQKANNCPVFTFFLFSWMAAISQMAKAFNGDEDVSALKWYLSLRVFETVIFARQVMTPYYAIKLEDGTRKLAMSEAWIAGLRKYVPVMVTNLVVCEIIPLTVAILLGDGKTPYFPAVYASIVMILLVFTIGALRNNLTFDAFDSEHLQERYELITLIFTGELCFAAGKRGNAVASTCVLIMAFVAYLLTFKSAPRKGHMKFWSRSILYSMAGLFLYAGVFCAIPAMGSAFARIIDADEMKKEGHEQKEGAGGISAGDLLSYSSGAFMVFTAFINLINVEQEGKKEIKLVLLKRGLIRLLIGCIILTFPFLIPGDVSLGGAPVVSILVPLLALTSASIEIWAVGSLKVAL
mmetsp:Transcript_7511/g.8587  ORF Transcript_7511/g.8587 Transcript_7511/m.8587 type:complete len:433 (+) Transcript_7511:23-1321(+)